MDTVAEHTGCRSHGRKYSRINMGKFCPYSKGMVIMLSAGLYILDRDTGSGGEGMLGSLIIAG